VNHGKLGFNQGKLAVIVFDLHATVLGVDDYALEDLVRLSGYSARGIRHYIQLGLLARPKVAGRATRYSRETLGRLSAIRVWRDKDGLSVPRIKRELRKLEASEVQSWADELEFPEGPAPMSVGALAPPQIDSPSATLVGDRWVRLPLVPGLDLVLREVTGEDVVKLAQEIQAKYGANAKG
jgi:DNA-binding transcriptional MerR regulator